MGRIRLAVLSLRFAMWFLQYEGLSADIQKMSLQIRACRLPRLLDVMAAPAKETQEGSVV